jgi:hypothetical protein
MEEETVATNLQKQESFIIFTVSSMKRTIYFTNTRNDAKDFQLYSHSNTGEVIVNPSIL